MQIFSPPPQPEPPKKPPFDKRGWFLFISGLAFVGVAVWKMLTSNFEFGNSNFSFSDFLSIILAMFSVVLAIAFYFKATETSNTFYDNTYKFTKDISEILGRIEAGFGEKLRHLDEGYSGMLNRFSNSTVQSELNGKETQKEIEEETLKLKEEIAGKDKILEDLMQKANLEADERKSITRVLREKEQTISELRRELRFLKNSSRPSKTDNTLEISILRLLSYIVDELKPRTILEAPRSLIAKRFEKLKEHFSPGLLEELQSAKILDAELHITGKGFLALHEIAIARSGAD